MRRQDIREHIFRVLFRVEFNPSCDMSEQVRLYLDNPVESAEGDLCPLEDENDKKYIADKYEKINTMMEQLDELINSAASGWNTKRMGKADLTILRLATYEALYDEDIPMGVAIDQAVELAKKYGQDESPAFVNGILSGIVKSKKQQ
ncbi:MAG: transcription antitermination factor NusB [Lachnospiraceae bacterium]|nr:transcription antitermination factor NusB [Lachnospiraceae bacterium]